MSIEETLDQFDLRWRQGEPPSIGEFVEDSLPPAMRWELLCELVAIDLEYRWRRTGSPSDGNFPAPFLQVYVDQFPEFTAERCPIELIAEEFRVRQRWGDGPDIREYLSQFGDRPGLKASLQRVHVDLQREHSESETAGIDFQYPTEVASQSPTSRSFGRYELEKLIGRGGMGEVWLAHDTQLERRVALKLPHLNDAAPQLRERFVNEAKAAATLLHPGICPVFDAGEIDGQPFITMAYIEGETLGKCWERGNFQSLEVALPVLAEVAKTMQVAHDAGIVHRDLKPSNVMINSSGAPIVTDFGLAARTAVPEDERITRSGETFGSPAYMSPEQVEGRAAEVGPASDIHSLGVMLFEVLTGQRPFQGTATKVQIQIARDEPPRPRDFQPNVDTRLEAFCLQMLAKRPENRPASMSVVAERLTGIHARLITSRTSSRGQWRELGKLRSAIAGTLFAVVLLAVILLSIQTPHGTIKIELPGEGADDIRVRVFQDGKLVEVADQANGWTLKLTEGEYDLKPGKGNVQFDIAPDRIVVEKNRRTLARVMMTEPPVDNPPSPVEEIPDDPLSVSQSDSNSALSFDGLDDHVLTPIVYDGSHPVTFECWVAPVNPWENGLVIANRGDEGFELLQYVNAQNPVWQCVVFADKSKRPRIDLFSQPGVSPRHHLAVVWDKEICRLFVNGKLRNNPAARLNEMPASAQPIVLGTRWKANGELDSSSNARFSGVIDEIRISKTARYQADFRPQERFEADDQTLALYHCDRQEGDVLIDASGSGNDAMIVGATTVPAWKLNYPGRYFESLVHFIETSSRPMPEHKGPALEFAKLNARVEVPPLEFDFLRPFTLEAWVTPYEHYPQLSTTRAVVSAGELMLKIYPNHKRWEFLGWDVAQDAGAVVSPWEPWSARGGRRTHLAAQGADGTLRLFINGEPVPGQEVGLGSINNMREFIKARLATANSNPLTIGRTAHSESQSGASGGVFGGSIDAFRLSSGLRYQDPFKPTEFTADESTVLLYDFREGSGDVLHDRSGNGYDAKIIDADWLAAPTNPSLPGLVAEPALLEGNRRWQVETSWTRADPSVHRFSPDGRWYALGGRDGYVRIYEGGPTGKLHGIAWFQNRPGFETYQLDWAPDSSRFVVACPDGWIRIWNPSGKLLHQWPGYARDISWSPDGNWVAGIWRGDVHLWKPDGTPGPVLTLHERTGTSRMSWGPDSKRLVASRGSTVMVLSIDGSSEQVIPISADVRRIFWSPDGQRIALRTADSLEFWKPSGRLVSEVKYFYEPVGRTSSGWSPDGQYFSATTWGQCTLWNQDGEQLWDVPSTQDVGYGDKLAWSPDGSKLAIAKLDRRVVIHSSLDGRIIETLSEEAPRISGLSWNDRHQALVTSVFAGHPMRMYAADGIPRGDFHRHKDYAFDVAWSRDGRMVFLAGHNELRRFDVSDEGQLQGPGKQIARGGQKFQMLAVHPTRDMIAVAGYQGGLQILNSQGEVLLNDDSATNLGVNMEFSPNGRWLAANQLNRRVFLWNTSSFERRTILDRPIAKGVQWSSDSNLLATIGRYNLVAIVDLEPRFQRSVEASWGYPDRSNLQALAWSPDNRWMVWSNSQETRAVNLEDGTQRAFPDHADDVFNTVWISPSLFVSASFDGSFTACNVETGQTEWSTVILRKPRSTPKAVTFSGSGGIRHADPGAADQLIYLVEREDDRLELRTRAEFTGEFPSLTAEE